MLSPRVSAKVLADKSGRISEQERKVLRDEAKNIDTKQEVSGGVSMK